MKRSLQLIFCLVVVLTMVTVCSAKDVMKIGVLQAFTGPIESLTPPMAKAADYAIQEVMDSNAFLDGTAIESVRADSTCMENLIRFSPTVPQPPSSTRRASSISAWPHIRSRPHLACGSAILPALMSRRSRS